MFFTKKKKQKQKAKDVFQSVVQAARKENPSSPNQESNL